MKNSLSCLALISLLCACTPTSVVTQANVPTLNVTEQAPLTLAPVHVKVKVEDGQPEYILDTKDYANLSLDLEQAQDYLDVQKKQLDDSKHYYDNLNK